MAIRKPRVDRETRFAEQAAQTIAPLPHQARPLTPPAVPNPPLQAQLPARSAEVPHEPATPARLDSAAPSELREAVVGQAGVPAQAIARIVIVLAAHPGAGASTVACAIAEAAAIAGTSTRLVDLAPPTRSGLITAADTELGITEDGAWQVGRRGPARLAVDRARAGATFRQPQPGDQLLVVDGEDLAEIRWGSAQIVLVARATVPGVRMLGARLDELGDRVAAAAVLGQSRWPGVVTAAASTATRAIRDADHLVTVPFDKQLEIEGVSSAPLPGRLLVAGARLLELLQRSPIQPLPGGRDPHHEGAHQ